MKILVACEECGSPKDFKENILKQIEKETNNGFDKRN